MSNKGRAIIKVSYYIIGMILTGYVTTRFSWVIGILLSVYLIAGAILSSWLKLPLLSKLHLYRVDRKYYSRADTFSNIMFTIVAIMFFVYMVVSYVM